MSDIKQVHTTLVHARCLLAEHGLAKNHLQDDDGHVCIRGAINLAATGDSGQQGLEATWAIDGTPQHDLLLACELAMGFEVRGGGPGYATLTDAALWNNLAETTEEMVLARFDRGIEATRPAIDRRRLEHREPILA